MKNNKVKILIIILLFMIFTFVGCSDPEPTSYDIYVMAQESGYDGTYSEWKKLIEGIDDLTISKVEVTDDGELILTFKNNETKNLGNIKKEIKYYNVKFMSLNEQVNEITVEEGSLIEAPTIEAPENNVLLGWYFGDDKWRFNMDTVEGDMTLVAKWDKYQEKVQPVYQGMSIEKQETSRSKRFSNSSEKSDIEDVVNDYIDVITTEQVEYYAKKGEKFNVVVHIYNPSFYEILSFTLNGRKYQSFEFKDGSNSTKLIIEVDAGMTPGIVEYTIDAIKYVDETEIKDVRMDGEKTIRAGVQYDVIPNASIIKEVVTTTSYQSIIEIKDDNQLMNENQAYFFLYDGKSIVYNTTLNVGVNNIKYDNLQMGSNYQYIIIGVFDDYSGVGKASRTLMKNEFSALDGYLFKETESGKDFIKVSINQNDTNATVKQINLLKANEIVSTLNSFDNIEFNSLNTNTEYVIEVVYNYTFEELERENKITQTVKTLENTIPSFEITEVTSSKYDIAYNVTSSDVDNVLINKNFTLLLNNEVVKTSNNESDVFEGLLSNNTYQLEIKYTYDLNDGNGVQEAVKTKEIDTEALDTPTLNIYASALKNQINITKIITDNDNIMSNFNLSVQNEAQVVINIDEDGNYIITNVDSNKQYTIVITYQYNLNDGKGTQNVLNEYKVLTSKEDPNILFTPYGISQNNLLYELLIYDKNAVGNIQYIGLYKGSEFIKRLDDTDTEITDLNSNTNYTIKVSYVYDFDDGYGSRTLNEEFKFQTLKEEPTYSLEFSNVSKYGFDISHSITDDDSALTFEGVDVLYNNQVVSSVDNIRDLSFASLLSDTEYLVKVKFTKNLNNGDVQQEYKYRVKTLALEKPTIDFDVNSTKNSIDFTYDIIDNDNVHTLKDVVVYYNNQIISPDDNGVYSNLYSNSTYNIKITLLNNYNDGSSVKEEVYEYTVKTQALEDIILDIKLESDKKSISYSHTLTDNDDISTIKEIQLYRGNRLQGTITDLTNKTFTNLLSNTLYKVVYVIEKDFKDNNDVVVTQYEETIKTKALEMPIVNIRFTATRDSILYSLNNVDVDSILNIEKIDVYKGSTLVKTIIDFTSNEITELDSNTGYTITVTYKYNLNDGNDDVIKTVSENYSTLADNVSILESVVLNDTAPKTNEDISVKFTLDNPSKVKVDYFVINGVKYPISGGDGYNTAIVIVRSPKMSCTLDLVVEKMGYTTNNAVLEQKVTGLDTLSIEILSRLDLIDISLVNGTKFDKKTYSLGYVLTIDNPDGYVIEKVDDIECEMIDNNHLYLDNFGDNYWSYEKYSISAIYYRDENNNSCVRNCTFTFDMDFALLDVDSDTNALIIKQVSTPEEFMNMNGNYIYELVNDIDMTGYAWKSYNFSGYFDGKGHTISNLSYTYESEIQEESSQNYNILIVRGTFKNVYFKDIYLDIDCPSPTLEPTSCSSIIYNYSSGNIENVLYSGYLNYKANDEIIDAYNSANTTYIVDHLYVNNVAVSSDKVITEEEFNSTEFKENTLGWNFKTKEISNYNGILYSVIDNSYIMISGYNGENPEVVIPSNINGLPVVGIEDLAFENNTVITSIEIPSDILVIGTSILKGCSNIHTIKIDNANALRYYNGRKDVNLFGNSFTTNKLTNVMLNSDKRANLNLNSIRSAKNVVIDGKIDFTWSSYNNNMINLTLSDGVKEIDLYNYDSSYTISNVYYKGTMEDLCNISFSGDGANPMYYAQHFYMLDSNNEYQEVTNIVIPDTVTEIKNYSFAGFNFDTIIIPKSVTNIGNDAFAGCYSLNAIFYLGSEEEFNKINIGEGNSRFTNANVNCLGNVSASFVETVDYSYVLASDNKIYDLTCLDEKVTTVDLTSEFSEYNVISLANGAFNNCSSLTTITLPDSLKSIGTESFRKCASLTSITIPSSVTSIGDYAFENCSSLTTITLPDSLKSIGTEAFRKCTSLTSITIPSSVTSIEDYTFENCSSLVTITLPDSLTSIGNYAFHGCKNLKSADLPENVTSIGNYAFYACDSLESITIPNGVTQIGYETFYSCDNLKTVSLPNTLTYIGVQAFQDCRSLEFIDIPDSVHTLDQNAFQSAGLKTMKLSKNVKEIGSAVFNCHSLKTIFYSGTEQEFNAITNNDTYGYFTSAKVYYNISSIEYVETDDYSYVMTSDNKIYDLKCLNTGIGTLDLTTAFSGYSIITLANSAFKGCQYLTSITLPDSLISIGDSAFENCSKLSSIIIPNGVTEIGNSTFWECSNLKSVVLPEGITRIGEYAFEYCTNLETVNLPNTLVNIEQRVFMYCYKLKTIKIPRCVTSIGSDAFFGTGLETIVLPKSVTTINSSAFGNCSSLKSVFYSGTQEQFRKIIIGEDNNNLTSANIYYNSDVTLEEVKTDKYSYILTSNKDIVDLKCLDKNVVTVDLASEFSGYNVISLADNAFECCWSLTSITLPDSLTIIGSRAFNECNSLTTIILPKSLIRIDDYAFACCSNITTVNYTGTQQQFASISIQDGNDYLKNATIVYNYSEN